MREQIHPAVFSAPGRSSTTDVSAGQRHAQRLPGKCARSTSSCPLTTGICGMGPLTAGKISGRVGSIHRFRSPAAFASYTGALPIEASSGDVVRYRLSRAGDRQLNCCLHHRHHPDRAYYQHKRTAGKSHKETLRCLKRQLSDVVYRQLLRDSAAERRQVREDIRGRLYRPARSADIPCTGTLDQSLPGPTTRHPTTGAKGPA
ncbi:transposase [Rhodococcus aetherivorans]